MNDLDKQRSIKIKRIYDPPDKADGFRVLVDRLWPRGLSKQKAEIDLWLKEVAPTNKLRVWFGHDQKKWYDFQIKYREELEKNVTFQKLQMIAARHRTVTLLFGTKNTKCNNAIVLKYLLEKNSGGAAGGP